jgi:hypothetical protein
LPLSFDEPELLPEPELEPLLLPESFDPELDPELDPPELLPDPELLPELDPLELDPVSSDVSGVPLSSAPVMSPRPAMLAHPWAPIVPHASTSAHVPSLLFLRRIAQSPLASPPASFSGWAQWR